MRSRIRGALTIQVGQWKIDRSGNMRVVVFFCAKHLNDLRAIPSQCFNLVPIDSFSHGFGPSGM
jgi:hypothetical protein